MLAILFFLVLGAVTCIVFAASEWSAESCHRNGAELEGQEHAIRNVQKLSCGLALRALAGAGAAVLFSNPALAATSQPVRTRLASCRGFQLQTPPYRLLGNSLRAAPNRRVRWRPPQPPGAWSECRKRIGSAHLSAGAPPAHDTAAERRLLFLNVWSGARPPPRGVRCSLIYGAVSAVAPARAEFDGENLARKGLVVVTFTTGWVRWAFWPPRAE